MVRQATVKPLTIAIALVVLVLIAGCATYRHQSYRPAGSNNPPPWEFDLHFVEADDEGWLWNPEQAREAVKAVQESAKARDTFVVLFIHGWNHSAECCDGNVEAFKEVLDRLHRQLSRPANQTARGKDPQSAPDFKLIGIYVGWRGRSLPGFLNYFTFWGRKSAAERIGETDVREFIARLNDIYLKHRPKREPEMPKDDSETSKSDSETPRDNPKAFLGLISIGHSFGAQVLLRATAASLEEQLEHLNPKPGYLRQPGPATADVGAVELKGIGDLVILLNPATEAAAYQRLHLLSMGLCYQTRQTPVMLTVSAENDRPRHTLFRIGRILGELFTGKPRKHDAMEREMERTALGVFGEPGSPGQHVTHRMSPNGAGVKLVAKTIAHTLEPACQSHRGECECEWPKWDNHELQPPKKPITLDPKNRRDGEWEWLADYDFSNTVVLEDLVLAPLDEVGRIEYQPLIVATADPAVITGHSGVFTEPFLQFLTSYIAFIESKLYLLRSRPLPNPLDVTTNAHCGRAR